MSPASAVAGLTRVQGRARMGTRTDTCERNCSSSSDRKTRLDGFLAVEFVDDVDPVIGSVGAGNTKEDRCPTPEAEPTFLLQFAG
jgi:hypothetical protein